MSAWPPERRAAQAERMRQCHADPAFERKRIAGMKSSLLFMAGVTERMRANRRDPQFNALHAAAMSRADMRSAASKRATRERGGEIPAGYEEVYSRVRKKVGAREALRIVREERARELRRH